MTSLASLPDDYRAWVFGAGGGIGSALVRHLRDDPRCAAIYAGARAPLAGEGKVTPFTFALEDEASIAAAVEAALGAGTPDLVLVTTGLLHAPDMPPEKAMRSLSGDILARSYAVNAIGPALIAKHVLPHLPRDRKSVFAALSARVSSLSDNRSGGWHGSLRTDEEMNEAREPIPNELPSWLKHELEASDLEPLFTSTQREVLGAGRGARAEMVKALDDVRAGLLAGSDCPGCRLVPGRSLLRELELFVDAGLSPARALLTATVSPQHFLGFEDAGRIAPGMRADLVLLDGDPLADIKALHQQSGVVVAGRWLPKDELARRLLSN